MAPEFWIDGFNFFHHWRRTRDLFAPGSDVDIAKAVERALRILARELGGRTGATSVFLDGGLDRRLARLGAMRVLYAGPGQKADDRMVAAVRDKGESARSIAAVSNDRELRFRLIGLGASCMTVGEYLDIVEKRGRPGPREALREGPDDADVTREKRRPLSPAEVQAWLEFFGAAGGE